LSLLESSMAGSAPSLCMNFIIILAVCGGRTTDVVVW
jgi:hypothetical protein